MLLPTSCLEKSSVISAKCPILLLGWTCRLLFGLLHHDLLLTLEMKNLVLSPFTLNINTRSLSQQTSGPQSVKKASITTEKAMKVFLNDHCGLDASAISALQRSSKYAGERQGDPRQTLEEDEQVVQVYIFDH